MASQCFKSCMSVRRQLEIAKPFLQSSCRQRICQRSLSASAFQKVPNQESQSPALHRSINIFSPWQRFNSVRHMSIQIPRTSVPNPSQIGPLDEEPDVEVIVDEATLALLDEIYETDSVQGVLDLYNESKTQFNEVHTARALWRLSHAYGRNYSESEVLENGNLPATIGRTELVTMDGFTNLCTQALRDSLHMDNALFLVTFNALIKLQIPESSSLVQTLLEQSKHRINSFNVQNLTTFASILDNMSSSNHVINALLDGIALRIPELMDDITSLRSAVTLMKVIGKKLSIYDQSQFVNKFIAILTVKQEVDDEIDIHGVISSMKSLVGMRGHKNSYCDLAVDYLKDRIDELTPYGIVDVMITLQQLRYYDEEFCQVVGDLIVENISEVSESSHQTLSINQISHLCRVYSTLTHLHPALLDAIARFVCENPHLQCSFRSLLHVIQPFAKLDYLPPNKQQFLNFIMNGCDLVDFEQEDMKICITMATYLVQCGKCPEKMMKLITDEGLSVAYAFHLKQLYQAIKVRSYENKFPELQHFITNMPEEHLEKPRLHKKLVKPYIKARHLTRKTLSSLVGDGSTIKENTNAGLGYSIDFELCPGESKQAIMLCDASFYSVNVPHHVLMMSKITQQYLESNGYQVAWIQVEDILSLRSSDDLEAYIQTRIKTSTNQ